MKAHKTNQYRARMHSNKGLQATANSVRSSLAPALRRRLKPGVGLQELYSNQSP